MNSAIVALALLTPVAPPPTPGAPDVKENVRTGLKWLADQQKADGTWSGQNGIGTTAATATAGLAFLMEGSTPTSGTYAPQLQKVLEWLEKNTADNGQLASNTDYDRPRQVPNHARALLFLACAYDVDDDAERRARLAKRLEKAVKFAIECQTARGGWGLIKPIPNRRDPDDSMSTATVLRSLLAVRKAGIDVPKTATHKALQYLIRATDHNGGINYNTYGGQAPPGEMYPVYSAAVASAALTTDDQRPDPLPLWVKFGHRDAISQLQYVGTPAGSNMSYHYNVARVAYAVGEDGYQQMFPDAPEKGRVRWSEYRAAAFKAIKEAQSKDGSWRDDSYGTAYSTALALIILQLDNEYLPAFAR